MNQKTAVEIFQSIETLEVELNKDFILHAARYARLRTDWQLASTDERRAMDSTRTAAHNALIDAANILSRAMAKAGEDTSWRLELGKDRKEIGDWACLLHAYFGLQAR